MLAAGSDDSSAARVALAALCETYWYPLYAYARRRGAGAEDARDLTQAFLASLIERRDFERVRQDRGRFRAFLLASRLESHLAGREEMLGRGLMAGVEMARRDMSPARFGELAALRAEVVAWTTSIFERYDLLLTPTVPFDPYAAPGPYPTETEGRRQAWSNVGSFTIPFNLSWHPAATVRVGLSRAGLPMGMQVVGPLHRDDLVLQAARAFEMERPWHPHWPTR